MLTDAGSCPSIAPSILIAHSVVVFGYLVIHICVPEWMRSNRLQLNAAKTEILWSATSRRLLHLPQAPLRVGTVFVTPSAAVRDLGIYLDSDMLMSSHVRKTLSTCFAVLRQLRSIHCSVSRPVVQSLVTSLVLSRLDYGNATLAGIPQHLLRRLQSVMYAAARLISSLSRFDHITSLLRQLHWLKTKERIGFKLAERVFKCIHRSSPPYLADELSRPVDSLARCRLRSVSSSILVVRHTRLTIICGHCVTCMEQSSTAHHHVILTFESLL